ncbi:replicative DNA helicase [Methylobacterium sp. J-059]|uniref:replicative DNA helicase n=1 Tax=Methylobacterium sp. J-059 TaxID=2836643 RepID=UPI001FBBC11B|nr:replicative DNA helicase [Methylobacterium sp. J-059]MCJ2041028.1 replicative DNA helicase [Methylobacterium sp. J-059]
MNALSASLDATPPNALESEQGLLGAILHHNDAIDRARDFVQPDDFSDPIHRQIFVEMVARRDAGEAIDLGLMKAVLGDADLGGVTVGQYLVNLMHGATTISNAPSYARLVAQAARMRTVFETSQFGIAAMTGSTVHDPAETAGSMIEALDAVASASLADHARRVSLGTSTANVLARANQVRQGAAPNGVPYGVPRLDAATLGMRSGQLIILAGRPAMGKTTAGLHVAISAAQHAGPVGFFSLEMDADQLSERILAAVAYDPHARDAISYRAIAEAKNLSNEAMERLIEAQRTCNGIPLWMEQQSGLTLAQIAARARQMRLQAERRGQPLSAIIIDHISLIRPSKRYSGNRVQEMTEISSGLKGLAKDLGIPVVALCQLNREVEKRPDKRPMLSDLRESGSIEQDADVVLGLFRESYYLERKIDRTDEEEVRLVDSQNELEIEILKQRSGPTIRVTCFCDIACNVLAEMR